jgi:hypothetical protein
MRSQHRPTAKKIRLTKLQVSQTFHENLLTKATQSRFLPFSKQDFRKEKKKKERKKDTP